MKKVLLFHSYLPPYRVDFFNRLAEKCDLEVVFLWENVGEQPFERDELLGRLKCKYTYLTKGLNPSSSGPIRWGVRKLIKRVDPDVIITHEYNFTTIFLYLWRRLFHPRWRLMITTDDSLEMCGNCRPMRRVFRRIATWLCDRLIVCNAPAADWYSGYNVHPSRISLVPIIPSEKPLAAWTARELEIANEYRERYALVGKRVFLFVGRLVAVKNIELAIAAFAASAVSDSVFAVVGSGEELERLEECAERNGVGDKVIFPGRFEGAALYAWYRLADLFVLPSYYEPFGAVTGEALIRGVPVLISSVCGSASLVETPQQGQVFTSRSADELTKGFRDFAAKNPPQAELEARASLLPRPLEHYVDRLADEISLQNRLRVVFIQPFITSYRVDFFRELARHVELEIIYFWDSPGRTATDAELAAMLPECKLVRLTGGISPRGYYPLRAGLGRAIAQFSPDWVISHEFNTATLHAWLSRWRRRANWKLAIWTSDDVELVAKRRGVRGFFRNFFIRRAQALLVYSPEVMECYRELVPATAGKMVLCPNVQSVNRLRGDAVRVLSSYPPLPNASDFVGKRVFLFVGRLEEVKNISGMVRGFVAAELDNALLLIVGRGSEEESLTRLISELDAADKVVLAGYAAGDELMRYYLAADALVLASWHETFGAVVNEALALGKPVILSAHAGARVLLKRPDAGIIVEPGSSDSIAAAFRGLAEQLGAEHDPIRESLMPWDLDDFIAPLISFFREKFYE